MKSSSNVKPERFQKISNGSYRYCYDILEVEKTDENTNETYTQYDYKEVIIYTLPTADSITEAVITEEYSLNYQQKLVNEYNMVKLGMIEEGSDEANEKITAYTDYLARRAELKNEIDEYFK